MATDRDTYTDIHSELELLQAEVQKLKKENESLRLWQEELRAALDATLEGVEVVDSSGKVIYVNRSFETILEEKAEERIGKNIYEVSPNGALVEALRDRRPVFGKIHTTLNGKKVVSANSSPILVNGKALGAVSVFSDISDIERMSRLLEKRNKQVKKLQEQVQEFASSQYGLENLIGESQALRQCIAMAYKMANSNATVLLSGESGTGKELFAHGIHQAGNRAKKPFIKINCAAIPDHLLESEFFGYEAGAFTGAAKAKMGKFELADTGTLFLDEIGEMNLLLQAKLLRVLQDKEVERLGGLRPRKVDVRIIAATNKDLKAEVAKGCFRQDLYYRLNVVNINVPPLRQRREDIPPIAAFIIKKFNEEYSSNFILTEGLIRHLMTLDWPGNVRELENYLGKLVLFSQDGREYMDDYCRQDEGRGGFVARAPESSGCSMEDYEKKLILSALEMHGYDTKGKQRAAKELKISLSTLYNKLRLYKQQGKL